MLLCGADNVLRAYCTACVSEQLNLKYVFVIVCDPNGLGHLSGKADYVNQSGE